MRTAIAAALALSAGACASTPNGGGIEAAGIEGSAQRARIVDADTAHPPRSVSIAVDDQAYAAVLLVAPGHSATLLYPSDSLTNNRLGAGAHRIDIDVPSLLVQYDSIRNPDRMPREHQRDSSVMYPGRQSLDSISRRRARISPLSPTTPTYLLLVTSPQPLVYSRLIEKTAGVSIPTGDIEALSAVGKAIKATLVGEPREWSGYYRRVEIRRRH